MRRLLGRLVRVAIGALVALVVLLGAAYLLRVPLFGGLVKGAITSELEAALGGRYEIESIGGSWISDLELRGLRTVEPPPDGPLVSLAAADAQFAYDPLGLLGDRPLAAVRDVRVRGVRVALDVRRPSAPDDDDDEALDLSFLDDLGAPVRIEGGVRVETRAGPVEVRGVRLAFGGGVRLQVTAEDVSVPEPFEVRGPLAGRVERVGPETLRWTSDAVLGEVRVPEATITTDGRVTGHVEVAGGRVDVRFADGVLVATTETLDVAALPAWARALVRQDVPLPTAGRLAGRVRFELTTPPRLALEAAADDLVWRGETFRRAELAGAWQGGWAMTIDRLDVSSERGRARVRDAVLDPRLPFLLRDVAALRVEILGARAFLPELERDLAVALEASSVGRSTVRIERLSVADEAGWLEAEGVATLPADPEAWRSTRVEAAVRGSARDLAPLPVELDGHLAFDGRIDGTLDALGLDLSLRGRVRDQEVERLGLQATLRPSGLEVEEASLRAAGAELSGRGRLAFAPLSVSDAAWAARVPDLGRLARAVPADLPALAGRLEAEGRLHVDGETVEVWGQVDGEALAVDGEEVGALSARVRTEGRRVLLEAADARGPWGRVRLAGHVEPAAGVGRVLGLVADVEEVQVALRAPLAVRWSESEIRLEEFDVDVGDARLRGGLFVRPADRRLEVPHLVWGEDGETGVRLTAPLVVAWAGDVVDVANLAVAIGDEIEARGALRVDAAAETARVSALTVRGPFGDAELNAPLALGRTPDGALLVRDLDASYDGWRVRGQGRVLPDESRGAIEALHVKGDGLEAHLDAEAGVAWSPTRVEVSELDIETLGGRILGRIAYGEALEVELEGRGFALERWVPAVTGEARFRLRGTERSWTLVAKVPEARFAEWTGDVWLEAHQDETGGLVVDRLRIGGPTGGWLEGRAVSRHRLTTSGLAFLEEVEPSVRLWGTLGGLDLLTELADGPVRFDVQGDAQGLDVSVRVQDVVLCDEESGCDDVLARLRLTREGVDARLALANEEFLQVRGHARLDRGFDWSRPEGLDAFLDETRIEGELAALVRRWQPLADLVGGVRRLEGGAGANLRFSGRLRDPKVQGVLVLDDVAFAAESDLATFEGVDAQIRWDDDRLHIERLEGEMGYAPFRIGGTIAGGLGREPVFDLEVHGRNTMLVRTDYVRMRVDLDGTLTGPLSALHLAGEGRIVDSVFREPVSLASAGVEDASTPEIKLFEIDEGPFANATFDVAVKADESIRFRNNLLRLNMSADGVLKGTGADPAPVGRAWFRNADILLPLTTLRYGEGEIVFLEGAPGRPRIQMTARARTRGYELGAQIAGRLPDVNVYAFTEPYLDEEEAILLLATGQSSAELAEGGVIEAAFGALIQAFGGPLLSTRGVEGEPGDRAFFERLSFETEWAGGRLDRLRGQFEFTDRLYFALERDRYDQANVGLLWRLRFR